MDSVDFCSKFDFGENDFNDFLDGDVFGSSINALVSPETISYETDPEWLTSLFDDPVLNDKMMTEALQPGKAFFSEHSYSLSNNDSSTDMPLALSIKQEANLTETEMEVANAQTTPADLRTTRKELMETTVIEHNPVPTVTIKQEPGTRIITTSTTTNGTCYLKQPTIVLSTQRQIQPINLRPERIIVPKVNIKAEKLDCDQLSDSGVDVLSLPPTPPSSNNSDSDGSLSPQRSAPSSPIHSHQTILSSLRHSSATQALFTDPVSSSHVELGFRRIPTSGILYLSEEEKRTLITEGYPIPSKLPLTKQEEKNLKKIRRKIKNKISAQESRRKKKEYLETLEKKVEAYTHENSELKRKVDNLEGNNRSLMSQLHKLQALVGKVTKPGASSTQTGTCLMVLVLCFALFLGSWSPSNLLNIGYTNTTPNSFQNPAPQSPRKSIIDIVGPAVKNPRIDAYFTPNKRSRVLLSMMEEYEPYGPNMPIMVKGEQEIMHPDELFLTQPDTPNPDHRKTGITNDTTSTRVVVPVDVTSHISNVADTHINVNATA